MRDLPTALYPDDQGVTLKCEKLSEAVRFQSSWTFQVVKLTIL